MIRNESSYMLNEQNIRKSKLNDSIKKILDECLNSILAVMSYQV